VKVGWRARATKIFRGLVQRVLLSFGLNFASCSLFGPNDPQQRCVGQAPTLAMGYPVPSNISLHCFVWSVLGPWCDVVLRLPYYHYGTRSFKSLSKYPLLCTSWRTFASYSSRFSASQVVKCIQCCEMTCSTPRRHSIVSGGTHRAQTASYPIYSINDGNLATYQPLARGSAKCLPLISADN
jgi:hypothetical protein